MGSPKTDDVAVTHDTEASPTGEHPSPSSITDLIGDGLVGFFLAILRLLPRRTCHRSARGLGRLLYALGGSRRKESVERAQELLGVTEREARSIVLGSYQTLVLNVVEPLQWIGAKGGEEWLDRVEIQGREHLEEAFQSGRPVLLCSGHIGAWELIPMIVGRLEKPIWVIGRPFANARLNVRLDRSKRPGVAGSIDKDEVRKLTEVMRRGEALLALLDQRARRHGLVMPFLGRPASQHRLAGAMGRRLKALCLPVYVIRKNTPFQWKLVVEAPVEVRADLEGLEAELDVMSAISDSLENLVRSHPEQWLWIHDRWYRAETGRETATMGQQAGDGESSSATPEGTNLS
ncbi:MAG: lysophospholipid acyltransferase family protein [Planctomycetota bacterium]|nr:lysophospholipid acyltransferase family protein [Planctomycetota bacterium]